MSFDLDNIYNKSIIGLASNISRIGKLENANASAEAVSKICGSKIKVYLLINNDIIEDYAHEVKACSLGQASSAILAKSIVGCNIEEILQLGIDMHNMIKKSGKPPIGKFAELELLLPVRSYPPRQSSTLLIFVALKEAIENYQSINQSNK